MNSFTRNIWDRRHGYRLRQNRNSADWVRATAAPAANKERGTLEGWPRIAPEGTSSTANDRTAPVSTPPPVAEDNRPARPKGSDAAIRRPIDAPGRPGSKAIAAGGLRVVIAVASDVVESINRVSWPSPTIELRAGF